MTVNSKLQRHLPRAALALSAAMACLGSAAAEPLHREYLNGATHAVLGGGGANVTFSAGPDGLFFVDSGARRDAADVLDLAKEVSDAPVRYLVNTHAHPEHTGGNARFGKAGAVIVAHEEVRDVIAADSSGSQDSALPVITLSELGRVSFDFNDETIEVFHVAPAHSPGNVIVHFAESNVIHVGALFSPISYPTITGGTVEAWIGALNEAVRSANFETRVVPSSGPVSDREGLIAYREMLIAVRERVIEALDRGQTLEQFVATRPTREFDARYGDPSNALFLPVVYREMSLRRQPAGE
ncbi:MAG TPA: MBL fold metallo-hydrolase [Gammaproteobacteria bacterium]|nr:MBL fold metallo-hydrolase [Gammaproteobacteria bacterium]